jgi:hypothetical protein
MIILSRSAVELLDTENCLPVAQFIFVGVIESRTNGVDDDLLSYAYYGLRPEVEPRFTSEGRQ